MRAFVPAFLACLTVASVASAQEPENVAVATESAPVLQVAEDPKEVAVVVPGASARPAPTPAPEEEPDAEWGLGFGMTGTFHTLTVTGLAFDHEGTRFVVDGDFIGAGMGLTLNVSLGVWRVFVLRGAYGGMGASTQATATFERRPDFDELGGPTWARVQLGSGVLAPIENVDIILEGNLAADFLSVRLGEDTAEALAPRASATIYEAGATVGARVSPFGCMFVEMAGYAGIALHRASDGVRDVAAGLHITAGCDTSVQDRHRD